MEKPRIPYIRLPSSLNHNFEEEYQKNYPFLQAIDKHLK